MAELIEMLALSPTMDEGTLVEWHKNEGDPVEEGDVIAEIETDKATMEMESFFSGTLLKILVPTGQAVPVGAPMAIIGEKGEDISDLLSNINNTDNSNNDNADLTSENPKEQNNQVDQDNSHPSPSDSSSSQTQDESHNHNANTTSQDSSTADPQTNHHSEDQTNHRIFSSPLARKIASEKGLDLSKIEGSGPGGRIVKADVENYTPAPPNTHNKKEQPTTQSTATNDSTEKQPLSQMRKTIAKRLGQAWNDVPHFFLTMSIDMGPTMALRKTLNQQFASAELPVKISVNDFIIKACGLALQHYPAMNRSFRGDHFVSLETSDIGVAVAIEDGLITPVIRNVESISLSTISSTVKELAARAKEKKLKPEEYTGSSFSISNLGMFGIEQFTAIINPPEAGILACGAVQKVPIVNQDGEISVGTQMKVTLSCDHRIIDGATGAEFLNVIKKYLENPILMLA